LLNLWAIKAWLILDACSNTLEKVRLAEEEALLIPIKTQIIKFMPLMEVNLS